MTSWVLKGLCLFLSSAAAFAQSPNSVQMLIANLSDSDPGIRTQAAIYLASLGTDAAPAVPALIRALADKEPNVRYRAVIALGKAGSSTAAIKALIGELGDTSKDIRYEAATALGAMGEAADSAVEPLLKCLESPDRVLVARAGGALQKIKPKAATAMPIVMRLLRDGDQAQKVVALDLADAVDGGPSALDDNKTGPRTFDMLAQLVNDKSPAIREKALVVLQSVEIPESATHQQLDGISSALHDPDEDIRVAAVKVFAVTSDENLRAVPLSLISDADASVRLAVIEVAPDDVRSVPVILSALDDPSSAVRAAAMGRLHSAEIGRDEICVAVTHATEDRFVGVRAAAAAALGDCSDARSWKALAAMTADPLAEVRVAALKSIATVRGAGWQARRGKDSDESQLYGAAVRALNDEEADVREAAGVTLQTIAPLPETYLDSIAVHLSDPSKVVRTIAARLVGTYGVQAKKYVAQLRDLLRSEDKEVSQAAVESLGLIEADDKETVEALMNALDGFDFGDDSLREATLLTLGRIGPPSKGAVSGVVATIAHRPGVYDVVTAGIRSLREMGPEARTALTELYARTPASRPADEPITLENLATIYQPTVQKLIDEYDSEIKSVPVHLKTPEGTEIDVKAGGRSVVIAIGTWCPHSRRLIDFLSNARVRTLTAKWNFNFVLFDETPEIDALGGIAEISDTAFDKSKYPSPVPLYDVSILAKLPGRYFFYTPSPKQRVSLPSVFEPDKGMFGGSASKLITRELGIPNWIEATLEY